MKNIMILGGVVFLVMLLFWKAHVGRTHDPLIYSSDQYFKESHPTLKELEQRHLELFTRLTDDKIQQSERLTILCIEYAHEYERYYSPFFHSVAQDFYQERAFLHEMDIRLTAYKNKYNIDC